MPSSRLIIVEPGAVAGGGHYAGYAEAVAQGAFTHGLAPVVVGNVRGVALSLAEDVPVLPALLTVWHEADARGRDRATDGIASDLAAALAGDPPRNGDRVLFPTLGVADLASVLEAAVEAPALAEPVVQHLLLRYDPAAFIECAARLRPLFERVAASPQLSRTVRLHSDTDGLARAYAELSGLPVTRLPIPFPQARLREALLRPTPARPPLRLAFFGDARAEKRFHTIADAVDTLWDEWIAPGRLAFSLQCPFSALGPEPAAAAAIARLRARGSNRLELVETALDEDSYYARLAAAHAVLLPYDPERYALRSSGVLVEALAAGRPVAVPAGSWMAGRITPDQGVVYDAEEGLADGILRLVRNYERLAAGAQARAADERLEATGDRFVAALLGSDSHSSAEATALGGVTATDVENVYRLLLDRRPESRAVVEANLGATPAALLDGVLASAEFESRVRSPPLSEQDPPPSIQLKVWLAGLAGLSAEGAERAREASDALALVTTLLSDETAMGRLSPGVRTWAGDVARRFAQAPPPAGVAAMPRTPAWGADEDADVDLLVVAEGSRADTLACLDAVAAQRTVRRVRVLVFDDADGDAPPWADLKWLRALPGPGALGFARAIRAASLHVRSPLLLVLSDAVRPEPDWLEEVARALETMPEAGIVGSRLNDSGSGLLDAGGVLWADGNGWRFGCGDDPRRSRYAFARPADFVSRLAFGVHADLWRKLDGFDPDLRGMAAEGDLALRARVRGADTWIQPLAQATVLRSEALEEGPPLPARWSAALAGHGVPGADPLAVMDRRAGKRLLVLEANPLTPDRDAGSVVTWSMIRLFQDLGWSVGFAAVQAFERDADSDLALNRAGVETFRAPTATSVDDIAAERPGFYDAVLGLRHGVLHPQIDRLRAAFPLASILFHNQDMHHLRMRREAEVTGNDRLLRAAELVMDEELELVARADCSFVTSTAEMELLRGELPHPRVVVLPYVSEVRSDVPGFEARRGVLFVGGFGHSPNLDAALHLVETLWPTLAPRLPGDAELLIAGADPPPRLQALAGPRVRVLGHVPDLDALTDRTRVSIVPLRFGAGVKGKLVAAMAGGLPSAVTPTAAEGKGLVDGRDALVAGDDAALVNAVVRLYSDAVLWRRVQLGGWAFAQSNYSREAGLERCREGLAIAQRRWFARRAQLRRARLASEDAPTRGRS